MEHPPKYPSTPHWPWSQKVHRDDSYHENPEFFVGERVVISEKLDGGNTCLWQGNVYARSTTQPAGDGWFAMVKKHHTWKTVGLKPELVFYGEDLYGIHSIEYGPIHEDETYRLFAVREVGDNGVGPYDYFQNWDDTVTSGATIFVQTVPVLFEGTFDSVPAITKWFEENLKLPSTLGGPREGFVMRTRRGFAASSFRQHMCKYVRANHVQTPDKHWRVNWRPCTLIRDDDATPYTDQLGQKSNS